MAMLTTKRPLGKLELEIKISTGQIETSWGVEDVATPALAGSRLAVALVSASTFVWEMGDSRNHLLHSCLLRRGLEVSSG